MSSFLDPKVASFHAAPDFHDTASTLPLQIHDPAVFRDHENNDKIVFLYFVSISESSVSRLLSYESL
jgi:hypothetical protein